MGRHYLGLVDARTLPTPGLWVATHRGVTDLLAAAAMGVVHGMAGLGKTYAVEQALARERLDAEIARNTFALHGGGVGV